MTTHRKHPWMNVIVIGMSLALLWGTSLATGQDAAIEVDATIDYGPALERLRQGVAAELEQGILTGVSIGLVDGQRVVLTEGFGWSDRENQVPFTAESICRVGSLSKLFTAVAVMQLAEQGKIDIDAPIVKYLPSFRIIDPASESKPITLRQIMCHRSGLVRESPIGGYFDGAGASIAQTVASLESCVLVNPPDTKTRYSNVGPTVAGQLVAAVSGLPFQQYQKNNVFEPLGMTNSEWEVDKAVRPLLAKSYMRVADGRGGFVHRQAPTFELGTVPAGNLYSNAIDLAQFAKMLLAGGELSGQRVIEAETLTQMFKPQLTDSQTGFGLGFYVGTHQQEKTVQHTGAVYGFSSSIVVLPEKQIAAIVLANEDIVPGTVKKISEAALSLMLEAKFGQAMPSPPPTVAMGTAELSAFQGQFESPSYWAEIAVQGDQLLANISGQPMTLRPIGPLTFEADGRFVHRGAVEFEQNSENRIVGFEFLGQKFVIAREESQVLPASWHAFVGSYGPDYIPLVVSVRFGHLYAMTENMVDYRLTPVNQITFAMPEGLYADEELMFQFDQTGQVHAAVLANMTLPRRPDESP